MNSRERWLACMRFQPLDHIPDEEFGYWDETFSIWHAQGLPEYVNDNWKADCFFGFEQYHGVPLHGSIIPGFEYKVLSEDDRKQVIINGEGVMAQVQKTGHSTIPHYLKFPIETREDWDEFKKRLDVTDPRRYPIEADWEVWKKSVENRDCVLSVHCGSLFGVIRNWMGFENAAMGNFK